MDYVKPADVAVAMLEAGKRKLALRPARSSDPRHAVGRHSRRRDEPCFHRRGADQPAAGRRADLPGRPDRHRAARPRTRHRQLRAGAAAVARPRGQRRRGPRQLGLGLHRQSDRQRRLWRAACHRADQYGNDARRPASPRASCQIAEAKTIGYAAHRLRRPGHRASSRRCCATGWSASPSCWP